MILLYNSLNKHQNGFYAWNDFEIPKSIHENNFPKKHLKPTTLVWQDLTGTIKIVFVFWNDYEIPKIPHSIQTPSPFHANTTLETQNTFGA